MRVYATTAFLCAFVASCELHAATDFAKDVAPIFSAHCVRCHSDGIAKGDVSLSSFSDLDENGYVVPGEPADSYLIELVSSSDGQPPEMPKESDPLSEDEVQVLRDWIAGGADWPDDVVVREKSKADATWWAYQPLQDTTQTVDELIQAKLAEQNLKSNPPADRRTLIRRATYDLTGLPPTPEEVDAFVKDTDPQAYEKLIDRLLESPRYGERWGRHWLDVVRFGESNGFERNFIINDLWPFRDYVIRSINEDKPFDQLIREHLAGDVFGADDPHVSVGSAFLVSGPYDDVKNQDPAQQAQIRANTLDEIINATGEAFLGMTLGCARCHDHKFDPITQEDYYGLYATFAGVRHGSVPLTTPEQRKERAAQLKPLSDRKVKLEKAIATLTKQRLERARAKLAEYQATWTRPPVDRTGTEDRFEPVLAKFVRLTCDAQDINPDAKTGFGIDEFEVWSTSEDGAGSINVALASNGGKATGQARTIEDFPNAYGPQLAIDGKTGARFLATGRDLTIELAKPTMIERIVFSSARNESTPMHRKFAFVAEYWIEVSTDGQTWLEVVSSRDRKPISEAKFVDHRLLQLEATEEDRLREQELNRDLATVNRKLAKIPPLPTAWIGRRVAEDARGPFHVFLGGSPQKVGDEIVPASLSVFAEQVGYKLPAETPESGRRQALADWITHPDNPLTPRVLANRLWHYHFGTGIVDTPSDFGYMGGRPSHPELLDKLAMELKRHDWKIKPLHRMIMSSQTYQQSSEPYDEALKVDGDTRLLWRFPPRRLSAEEVRDTLLAIAGKLGGAADGGPGFRLYHFMQDNVCTYVPLDRHGPETYRRAVYHQNARASVVDLMTEFDQPDCTFSAPKRAETTTPLQALTMFNHSFTLDMAAGLAERLLNEAGNDAVKQMERAFELCYSRRPSAEEITDCTKLLESHGLAAFCRVLLNTSELIYVQ